MVKDNSMAEQDWKATFVSKAQENFYIVLTILGIIIVVLAIVGGIGYNGWFPVADLYTRLILGVCGVVVVGLGLYFKKTTANTEAPKSAEYVVVIMYPQPGGKVQKADVVGTIKKPPPLGFKLWVFRVYGDGSIWPLRECRIKPSGDEWEAKDCDIGGQKGDKRELSVNLVGPDGAALIKYVHAAMGRHNLIRDELERATGKRDIPYSPLITERTRDMVECQRVSVERE